MLRALPLSTLMLLSAITFKAHAENQNERERVLGVVQRTFDAIASRDPQLWKTLLLEQGVAIAIRPEPDSGNQVMQLRQNSELIASIKPDDHSYLEQFTQPPVVLIHDSIAVVWGEYDFWIDGKFSHCGVDSIDLVKQDGQWQIANIMWTVETEDCPTNPQHETN